MNDIIEHLYSNELDVAVYTSNLNSSRLAYSFKWYVLPKFGSRIQILSIAEIDRMINSGSLKFMQDFPEGLDKAWSGKLYGLFPNPRIMKIATAARKYIREI